MKRGRIMKIVWVVAIGILLVFTQACSKKRQLSPLDGGKNESPEPPSVLNNSDSDSNQADMSIVSLARLEAYTKRAMNDPTDIKIKLTLDDFGDGAFGGYVNISYDDDGEFYESTQTSGGNQHDAQYNKWFVNDDNEKVWHGFFEDKIGAIVVVVDKVINLGDGGVADSIGGSVWFKNFGATYAPHPPTRCWFVRVGPYECRTFLSGGKVKTTSSTHPENGGYMKLGEFSGLSHSAAFNE